MNKNELIESVNQSLGMAIPERSSPGELKQHLADYINELIQSDFQKLVFILYRIDVSEKKLRQLLNENTGTDAGLIIADLIIERQAQKIKSRRESGAQGDIDEKEKW